MLTQNITQSSIVTLQTLAQRSDPGTRVELSLLEHLADGEGIQT